MKKLIFSAFVPLLSFIFLTTSCGGPKADIAASLTDPQAANNAPLVGTFFLTAFKGTTGIPYTSHQLIGGIAGDTDWTQSCSVTNAQLSTPAGDILCLVESHELDLFANGVIFSFAYPPGFCDYVEESPYYYFKSKPGVVANSVAYSTIDPVCPYDYSANGGLGPNCCVGSWDMSAGATPATQPARSGKYTGFISNCYSSSELSDFPVGTNGVPPNKLASRADLGGSVNRIIKGFYANNSSYPFTSNVRIANYFRPSDHSHATSNPLLLTTGIATAPIAFDSQMGFPTNPYYQYTCYDTDKEIKARIRVMVRKWNTLAELHQGGNPNISGTTPNGDPLNDFYGWRDFSDVTIPGHGPNKFPDSEE